MPDLTASDPVTGVRPAEPHLPHDTTGATVDPTPTYGADYFDNYGGAAYEYRGHWAEFFGALADNIIRQFNPRTVLDAGCAKGFLVQALRERGVEAYGFDASEYAIANAPDEVKPYVRVGSLAEPIEGRYDLVTCTEVIEHLAPADLLAAIDSMCAATDRVLLSSTPDGEHYGDPTHLSMRPPEEWSALFSDAGFFRNPAEDVTWLSGWSVLYERRPAMTMRELVRTYDRSMAEVLRESYELRRKALHLEHQLSDARAGGDAGAEHAELERLRSREERATEAMTQNLRLRDLLVVAERALGQVQGEVAFLRDQLHGYDDLASYHHAVMNSTTWKIGWKMMGPYRKVRGRMGK